jgi:hypothetical protein
MKFLRSASDCVYENLFRDVYCPFLLYSHHLYARLKNLLFVVLGDKIAGRAKVSETAGGFMWCLFT